MNKTLDDLLSETAMAKYEEQLSTALQVDEWTIETRQQKLADIKQLTTQIAQEATSFTQSILGALIEGRTLLEWKIQAQFEQAVYDMLLGILNQMNFVSDLTSAKLPVDYDWLIVTLRDQAAIITSINGRVDSVMAGLQQEVPSVEEV